MDEEGKHKFFSECYIGYYPLICRFILSVNRDKGNAEDMTQEVFCRFLDKIEHIEKDKAKSWLFSAARNVLSEDHRRTAREPLIYDIHGENFELPDPSVYEDTELRLILKEALVNLTISDRIIFEHAVLSGATYEETAAEIGLSKEQVKYRLRIIRKQMAEFLRTS